MTCAYDGSLGSRARRHRRAHVLVIAGGLAVGLLAPGLRRRPAAERRAQRLEPLQGVGDERQAAVLGGVEARGVEADDAQLLVAEHRPRAGREVLQARADGQHDVGARGQLVRLAERRSRRSGRRTAGGRRPAWTCPPSSRPRARRAARRSCAAAPPRASNARLRRPRSAGPCAPRSASAAAASSRWSGRSRRSSCTTGSNSRTGKSQASACTSCGKPMKAGPQSAGSTIVAIASGSDCATCAGLRDAVPVARDRPERVVDGDRRLAEVLDLLQHGIGDARVERVAGEQQQRQAVGVGDRRGRDHVHGAGADRGRRRHQLPPPHRLGEADRGQRHALLVLAAVGGQHAARVVQRLAQARHVAVAEDAEHARRRAAAPRRRRRVRWAHRKRTIACAVVSRTVFIVVPPRCPRPTSSAGAGRAPCRPRWRGSSAAAGRR